MSKEIEVQIQGLLKQHKYREAMGKAAKLPDGTAKKKYQHYFKIKDFEPATIDSAAKVYDKAVKTNFLKIGADKAKKKDY